jgi:outer membrane protein TolC
MRLLIPAIATFLMISCVTQKYQAPGLAVQGTLFRDSTSTDTTSIATLPYKLLFADTILQELIEEGLHENPDLKVAIKRMNEAGESFQQSRAALLPDLSANANVNPSRLSAAAQDIPPAYIGAYPLTTTLYQVSLTSTWEADIWGKLKSAKRSAFAEYLQTDAARRAIQTQLIADIANYYYLLLSDDEQLKIALATIANRQNDVTTLKALKESGRANGAEVVQSEANRASAELLVPDLKQNIREAENSLSILLGRTPGEIRRATLA